MAYFMFILFGFALMCISWITPRHVTMLGLIFMVYAVMFAGMRGDSKDYEQYVIMFFDMSRSGLDYPARLYIGKDPLFGALIITIQKLGLGVQWLFLVAAAIALTLKSRAFFRVFGSILTPLFVTICLDYFLHEFTQIRVAIALGFGFIAMIELCNGRKLAWALYSLLAVGFHISLLAIIVFELPLVFGIERNVYIAIAAFGTLVAVALIGNFVSVVSDFVSRAAVYERLGGVSDHMLIVATSKVIALSLLVKLLMRKNMGAFMQKLIKISFIFSWVGYGFILIFMNKAAGFGFRIYELFDAFSVFIIAAALLKRWTLPWAIAINYCMALLVLLSISKLLLPYQLASLSLW